MSHWNHLTANSFYMHCKCVCVVYSQINIVEYQHSEEVVHASSSVYRYITTPYKSVYKVAQLAQRKWVGQWNSDIMNHEQPPV